METNLEPEDTSNAIEALEPGQYTPSPMIRKSLTPAESRVEQIDSALREAYTKTPNITKEQAAILQRRFEDDQIEVLPDSGLIYLPHIVIAQRLTEAFGPGGWSIIKRQQSREGVQIFCEYVLLVDGAYVGEAPAGATYNAGNKRMSLDDVYEGTQGVALRRIAAKSSLNCGSQCWEPGFAREWCNKHRDDRGSGYKKYSRKESSFGPVTAPVTPPARSKPKPAPKAPPVAPKPSEDGQGDPEWFKNVPAPADFGSDIPLGTPIGEIKAEDGSRRPLFNLWANFTPGPQSPEAFNGFRIALDAAGEHYDFKSKTKGEK